MGIEDGTEVSGQSIGVLLDQGHDADDPRSGNIGRKPDWFTGSLVVNIETKGGDDIADSS